MYKELLEITEVTEIPLENCQENKKIQVNKCVYKSIYSQKLRHTD